MWKLSHGDAIRCGTLSGMQSLRWSLTNVMSTLTEEMGSFHPPPQPARCRCKKNLAVCNAKPDQDGILSGVGGEGELLLLVGFVVAA